MSRTLSLFLAAALVAGSTAFTAVPAVAIDFSVTNRGGEWHNNSQPEHNWGWRHQRRHQITPGFSFSFGTPAYAYSRPYRDDCYRAADGALYCRAN